ncbi:unnamed protein product [Thelazia callipaeda]|uniref:Piwi domain-containing protein n=1 Tax=Thelazia callipaeda TaxID=103827 RepID=A0A0N5CRR9_THECL|nr:unnamed protein product [Thelazia callipaeda]
MFMILLQLESWDGPITIVIVIPSANIAQFPSEVQCKISAHVLFRSDMGCNEDEVNKLNQNISDWKYPANVARNAARIVGSELTLTPRVLF